MIPILKKNSESRINADTDFKIEFSMIDRNKSPLSGQINGRINDHISDQEQDVLGNALPGLNVRHAA